MAITSCANRALTAVSACALRTQVEPLHEPPKPMKRQPAAATALSETALPPVSLAEHVPGQLMPDPETDPCPSRLTVKLTIGGGGIASNRTRTIVSARMAGAQAPLPPQAPPHAPNDQPEFGVARRTTPVPSSNDAVQVVPQSIPEGAERTLPCPSTSTVSWCLGT